MTSSTLFLLVAVPWMALFTDRVSLAVVVVAAAAMWSRHALDFAANALGAWSDSSTRIFARRADLARFVCSCGLWVYPETGGALAAFVAYAASNFIAAAIIWGVLLTKWHCGGFRLNREIVKRWWSESIPLERRRRDPPVSACRWIRCCWRRSGRKRSWACLASPRGRCSRCSCCRGSSFR